MSPMFSASQFVKMLKQEEEGLLVKAIDYLSTYVQLLYKDKTDFKLATVENFTGGAIARGITTHCDDSYSFFDRGFVLLNDQARREILYVPKDIQNNYHYNSIAGVEAMAKGAIMHSNARFVLVVSGFLNARELPARKKVGDVSFAIAKRTGCEPINFWVKSFERHYGSGNSKLRCLRATFDGISQLIKTTYESCSDLEKEEQRKMYDPLELFKNIDKIAYVLRSL